MAETSTRNDFYVTVSSNASTEYYPSNTVNHFRNRLAEPIRLSDGVKDGWEVGLIEILTPPNRAYLGLTKEDLTVELLYSKPEADGLNTEKRHTLTLNPFLDGAQFAVELANALLERDLPMEFKKIKVLRPLGRNLFSVVLNRHVYITFRERLRKKLGLDPKCMSESGAIGTDKEDSIECGGLVDVAAGFHSLWVYSDCCGHRAVGGVRVPLLRTIVVKTAALEEVVHQMFTRPDYVPVSQNYLPSLEVFITDNTGAPIPFFPGEAVITLHFRPRKD